MAKRPDSALAHPVSPLAAMQQAMAAAAVPGPNSVMLREAPFLAQIGLRGDPADAAFTGSVRAVLGADLPLAPNTVTAAPHGAAMWLGPDEWLVVAPPGAERELAPRLAAAVDRLHAAVVDLSASRTAIDLAGPRSREVLQKGCGLDLHPRAFAAGRCAQTALARTAIILHFIDETPAWRIYVRNSFAAYLATWLIDAFSEYRHG